jgi:hypothetical protein
VGIYRCPVHDLQGFYSLCAHVHSARIADAPSPPLEIYRLQFLLEGEPTTLAAFVFCDDCAHATGLTDAPALVERGEDFEAICDDAAAKARVECEVCFDAWRTKHDLALRPHEIQHRVT